MHIFGSQFAKSNQSCLTGFCQAQQINAYVVIVSLIARLEMNAKFGQAISFAYGR